MLKNGKKLKILVIILIIVIIVTVGLKNLNDKNEEELVTIKSEKELEQIYQDDYYDEFPIWKQICTLPFSFVISTSTVNSGSGILSKSSYYENSIMESDDANSTDSYDVKGVNPSQIVSGSAESNSNAQKDFSTTNIQVENVDEADIIKTDGDYIYSISENNVIITNVKDPSAPNISKKIVENDDDVIPEDLMLYNNKLVVIYEKVKATRFSYSYSKNSTVVKIYDITNKEEPKEIKNYELEQPYYTSRCIGNKLYVISSGELKEEDDKIVTYYSENGEKIDPGFSSIQYIKDHKTTNQSLISMVDLDNVKLHVKVNSYLLDIENAYISEDNIYLLNEEYEGYTNAPSISSIFGVKGIFGAFDEKYFDYTDDGYNTKIYKFNLLNDGSIKFANKTKIEGQTINQFSLDEHNGNLRVAVYNDKGSKIVVLDEKLKLIGETEYLAEGEKMYSSRFLENKAYLVTYKTVDPLFVIDLSDAKKPKVLGKLKIPGYSTYLHPYDENHIIGIGMQTQEKVRKNSSGKVVSTTATITGMKMALFDVSDVENPVQISDTVIGDSRTTSAILTNHKALLFSKEKELIAIPVNNYEEDFEIENQATNYESMVNLYRNYNKNYISEGYFVYKINLQDGFNLKGVINHDKTTQNKYYYDNSKLLRGLYIDNNLYTVSEDYIKVNNLENLEEISSLAIKKQDEKSEK